MAQSLDISLDSVFRLIDTWRNEDLGEVKVYLDSSRNKYVLHKQFALGPKFGALPEEMHLLEARIKELPEEVSLATTDYTNYDTAQLLFDQNDNIQNVYFEYSGQNLRKQMTLLKQSGGRISEAEALGYFGFLIGLGSFMEQGLEFHRSVCLKNLMLINGQLQLMNPYVSDSHIAIVLKEFVQPIVAMGEEWEPELFINEQLRLEIGLISPEVRAVNDLHRTYVRQMFIDCCKVFLCLANMKDDGHYQNAEMSEVKSGIVAIDGRFPQELITIVKDVLLKPAEQTPTFIEVNERMTQQFREALLGSIAASKNMTMLPVPVDEGESQSRFDNHRIQDAGDYQPPSNAVVSQRNVSRTDEGYMSVPAGINPTESNRGINSGSVSPGGFFNDNVTLRSIGQGSNFMTKDSLAYSANEEDSVKRKIFDDMEGRLPIPAQPRKEPQPGTSKPSSHPPLPPKPQNSSKQIGLTEFLHSAVGSNQQPAREQVSQYKLQPVQPVQVSYNSPQDQRRDEFQQGQVGVSKDIRRSENSDSRFQNTNPNERPLNNGPMTANPNSVMLAGTGGNTIGPSYSQQPISNLNLQTQKVIRASQDNLQRQDPPLIQGHPLSQQSASNKFLQQQAPPPQISISSNQGATQIGQSPSQQQSRTSNQTLGTPFLSQTQTAPNISQNFHYPQQSSPQHSITSPTSQSLQPSVSVQQSTSQQQTVDVHQPRYMLEEFQKPNIGPISIGPQSRNQSHRSQLGPETVVVQQVSSSVLRNPSVERQAVLNASGFSSTGVALTGLASNQNQGHHQMQLQMSPNSQSMNAISAIPSPILSYNNQTQTIRAPESTPSQQIFSPKGYPSHTIFPIQNLSPAHGHQQNHFSNHQIEMPQRVQVSQNSVLQSSSSQANLNGTHHIQNMSFGVQQSSSLNQQPQPLGPVITKSFTPVLQQRSGSQQNIAHQSSGSKPLSSQAVENRSPVLLSTAVQPTEYSHPNKPPLRITPGLVSNPLQVVQGPSANTMHATPVSGTSLRSSKHVSVGLQTFSSPQSKYLSTQQQHQSQGHTPTTATQVHSSNNHHPQAPQSVTEHRPYIFDEHGRKIFIDLKDIDSFAKIARRAPPGVLNQAQTVSSATVGVGSSKLGQEISLRRSAYGQGPTSGNRIQVAPGQNLAPQSATGNIHISGGLTIDPSASGFKRMGYTGTAGHEIHTQAYTRTVGGEEVSYVEYPHGVEIRSPSAKKKHKSHKSKRHKYRGEDVYRDDRVEISRSQYDSYRPKTIMNPPSFPGFTPTAGFVYRPINQDEYYPSGPSNAAFAQGFQRSPSKANEDLRSHHKSAGGIAPQLNNQIGAEYKTYTYNTPEYIPYKTSNPLSTHTPHPFQQSVPKTATYDHYSSEYSRPQLATATLSSGNQFSQYPFAKPSLPYTPVAATQAHFNNYSNPSGGGQDHLGSFSANRMIKSPSYQSYTSSHFEDKNVDMNDFLDDALQRIMKKTFN